MTLEMTALIFMVGDIVEEAVHKHTRTQRLVSAAELHAAVHKRLTDNAETILYMEPGERSRTVGEIVRRETKRLLERAALDGAVHIYTEGQVRHLLGEDAWTDADKARDLDGRADIRKAIRRLSNPQKVALVEAFLLKETPTSSPTVNDAVERLIMHMNGVYTQ